MIDLFFSLLNFALIIGIIIYGARRFLMPPLKAKVDEEKSALLGMHEEHRRLLTEQKVVEDRILAQEADCANFLEKVNQWRTNVMTMRSQKEAEALHLREKIEERVYQQSRYHTLSMAYKNIAPVVVAILEEDMKRHFADERIANGYVQQTLKNLKK